MRIIIKWHVYACVIRGDVAGNCGGENGHFLCARNLFYFHFSPRRAPWCSRRGGNGSDMIVDEFFSALFQLLGGACFSHGPYTFYKAVRISNGRVLRLGSFFLTKLWSDADLVSIGELQLLWMDSRGPNQPLASLRLYFLPENTPDGRRDTHGEVRFPKPRICTRDESRRGFWPDEMRTHVKRRAFRFDEVSPNRLIQEHFPESCLVLL